MMRLGVVAFRNIVIKDKGIAINLSCSLDVITF